MIQFLIDGVICQGHDNTIYTIYYYHVETRHVDIVLRMKGGNLLNKGDEVLSAVQNSYHPSPYSYMAYTCQSTCPF